MRLGGHCHLSFPLPSSSLPLQAVGPSTPGAGHPPAPRCRGWVLRRGPRWHPPSLLTPTQAVPWLHRTQNHAGGPQPRALAALPNPSAACFKGRNPTAGGKQVLKQPRTPTPPGSAQRVTCRPPLPLPCCSLPLNSPPLLAAKGLISNYSSLACIS